MCLNVPQWYGISKGKLKMTRQILKVLCRLSASVITLNANKWKMLIVE